MPPGDVLKLGTMLLCLVLIIPSIYSAPLSSYLVSSFTSPDPTLPFNHITINNITGDVYIGARQRLYQLNSDLTRKHTVDSGLCPSPNEVNMNDNKLLVVAPSPEDKLITCGGCDGYCETRSLTNISHDVVRYAYSHNDQIVVKTSDAPTVGAVVLGADFVSNGEGTVDGGLYLFTGISDATGDIRSFSKHSLVDLRLVQQVLPPQPPTPQNIFRHLITYMEYLYYFISRESSAYLGRLCRNSLDVYFASYTEIELQCGSHNVIQSAHIGPAGSQLADSFSIESTDDLLYSVFTSESSSALCVYKMIDVQQSFKNAALGCIQGTSTGTSNSYIGGSTCSSYAFITPPDSVQCTAYYEEDSFGLTLYRYASGTVPLSASPIITIPDVIPTSIVTTIERQHTVAFIGDTQGYLQKTNIVNSSFGYVYETVPVGSGSVLQEMFLHESTEQLTLATSSDQGSQVLTLNVTNCGQYQTCDECIGGHGGSDGDPYCGWCTLEARCTIYEACPLRDDSTRWLSYNALLCVSISDVQPNSLPYHQTQQEITVTVHLLPVLRSSFQYMCAFNSYEVSAFTTGNTVTCTSPPANGIPTIPDGLYFFKLPLSIVSTETDVNLVTTDFFFFDCSVIKSCSSCVTSLFTCVWCVYDNECTDDSSLCQPGDTVVIAENICRIDAPAIVTVENEGNTDSLNVTWTPPNGATHHVVTWSPPDGSGSGTSPDLSGTAAEYIITGLIPGALYSVMVTAQNGTAETNDDSKQGRTKPSPVSNLTESGATNESISAQWYKPSPGVVDQYIVSCSDGTEDPSSPIAGNGSNVYQASCVGLSTAGANYTITATSRSGNEISDESIITITAFPAIPSELSIVNGERELDLVWAYAGDADNFIITVTPDHGTAVFNGDFTNPAAEVTCLTPGIAYEVTIVTASGDKRSEPITQTARTLPDKSTESSSSNIVSNGVQIGLIVCVVALMPYAVVITFLHIQLRRKVPSRTEENGPDPYMDLKPRPEAGSTYEEMAITSTASSQRPGERCLPSSNLVYENQNVAQVANKIKGDADYEDLLTPN